MKLTPTIHEVELETKVVEQIICNQLAEALDGTPIEYAVMSMLTYCALLMKPGIEWEELQAAVMSTSQFLILSLSDTETTGPAN